jgi:hypothetical protein
MNLIRFIFEHDMINLIFFHDFNLNLNKIVDSKDK